MKRHSHRLPKGYNGTAVTTRHVADVLPLVLSAIHKRHEERHDLILTTWPQLIGPKLEKFTRAESFTEGNLTVRVNNSTLYGLLVKSEKPRLLSLLRKKFPKVAIHDIFFRLG